MTSQVTVADAADGRLIPAEAIADPSGLLAVYGCWPSVLEDSVLEDSVLEYSPLVDSPPVDTPLVADLSL